MDDSAPVTPGGVSATDAVGGGGLFFADATLDLEEAHGIAETPEPRKLPSSRAGVAGGSVELPGLNPTQHVGAGLGPGASHGPGSETMIGSQVPESTGRTIGNVGSGMQGLTSSTSNGTTNDNDPANGTGIGNGADSGGTKMLSSNPSSSRTQQATFRPRPPRRPRDVPWLVGFFLFVPFALLICTFLQQKDTHGSNIVSSKAISAAWFMCIVPSFIATLGLARLLYRTPGGGDGDDARQVAAQVLLAFAPVSLAVHPLMAICMYFKAHGALSFALIPLWFLVRDLWAMRKWRTTASTAGGRQAFFQAITGMALDTLSRSLKRTSFFRFVVAIVCFQFFIVLWWHAALVGAMGRGNGFLVLVALVAGKWATGTVARILGLLASGGVASWFVEQSITIEEMERMKASQSSPPSASTEDGEKQGMIPMDEFEPETGVSTMPEEYRSADAAAYQPVLAMDDTIDQDNEDADDQHAASAIWSDPNAATAKALLIAGLTVSFGSVAQCGLLGGLAQFAWSVLRNSDAASHGLSQRFAATSRVGFQGMQIGGDNRLEGATTTMWMLISKARTSTRVFVRNHTDLAMCQVAAYYKSYKRAAQDVSILVDGSGKSMNYRTHTHIYIHTYKPGQKPITMLSFGHFGFFSLFVLAYSDPIRSGEWGPSEPVIRRVLCGYTAVLPHTTDWPFLLLTFAFDCLFYAMAEPCR